MIQVHSFIYLIFQVNKQTNQIEDETTLSSLNSNFSYVWGSNETLNWHFLFLVQDEFPQHFEFEYVGEQTTQN